MKVFPVVHINDSETACRQAEVALDAGADGIYLIDHITADPGMLFEVHNHLDTAAFIGINMLGHTALESLIITNQALQSGRLERPIDALWADDVRADRPFDAVMEYKQRNNLVSKVQYYGGVAFKYTQTYTDNPEIAAQEVQFLDTSVDVVTTSGKGTGKAPTVEKIKAMRAATNKSLAIASGVTIDNVRNYAGIIDEVLIASSIETGHYSGVFDKKKMTDFIQTVHAVE